MEKTLFLIKPDGVKRGFVGEILTRMEHRGFKFERLELKQANPDLLREHYKDLVEKPFFPSLVEYMTSGPVIAGVLVGSDVIHSWRTMMGPTNPKDALPGTIRGDFAQGPDIHQSTLNIVHGSDSPESAQREISLWFGDSY